MTIQVLYLAGCPNDRAAIEWIENVLRTEHLSGKLVQIEVRDSDQAQSLRFSGSPTIRVNGVDIEPSARAGKDFGICCRMYNGQEGAPSLDLIRGALRDAVEGIRSSDCRG